MLTAGTSAEARTYLKLMVAADHAPHHCICLSI
jgi:hypothetical protein